VRDMPYTEVASIHSEPTVPAQPQRGAGRLIRHWPTGAGPDVINSSIMSGATVAVQSLSPLGSRLAPGSRKENSI
jgi:hypothetical protein